MRSLVDGRASEAAEFDTGLFPDRRMTDRTVNPIDYPGGAVGRVIKDTSMLAAAASLQSTASGTHDVCTYSQVHNVQGLRTFSV